eukprot:10099254-Karenia_brevis.AAC.1
MMWIQPQAMTMMKMTLMWMMMIVWRLLRCGSQYGHHSCEHTGLKCGPGGPKDLMRMRMMKTMKDGPMTCRDPQKLGTQETQGGNGEG